MSYDANYKPSKGDTVRVIAKLQWNDFSNGTVEVGQTGVVPNEPCECYPAPGYFAIFFSTNTGGAWCKVELVQRAGEVVDRAKAPEPEMYGTMPAELPARLPKGTPWIAEGTKSVFYTDSEMSLSKGRTCYEGATGYFEGSYGSVPVRFFDWPNIPRQPSHPQPVAEGVATSKPSRRLDPYALHREAEEAGDLAPKRAAVRVYDDELGRIAAVRRRKIEQLRVEMERPMPSTHPRAWPEDSGEELRVT